MRKVQLKEARKRLDELVGRAEFAGEPTLIMREGEPAAVLVPASWYHDEGWISPHEAYDSADFGREYEYRSSGARELDPGSVVPRLYRSSGPRELESGSDS